MEQEPTGARAGEARLESTAELLDLVRRGDETALNRLISVFAPRLKRWARGRLPTGARGLSDTDDLVQITLIRVLNHLEGFEVRRPGAFLAYLRQCLINNLRNEIRNAGRRPAGEPPLEELRDPAASPLERAVGRRALEAYEEGLEKLNEDQKAAVILRIELGCSHQEIADFIGSPSANAARMLVTRALVRLAELIDERALHGP